MTGVVIRPERPEDASAIRAIIDRAFAHAAHAGGDEAGIVERLREGGGLSISLVAEDDGLIGHVAFSPVSITDGSGGWFGLGPLAVSPDRQGEGIGSALVRQGLMRLQAHGASGCVVLGDPAYYRRFGFARMPDLAFPQAPPEYFMALPFGNVSPRGAVLYAAAFG